MYIFCLENILSKRSGRSVEKLGQGFNVKLEKKKGESLFGNFKPSELKLKISDQDFEVNPDTTEDFEISFLIPTIESNLEAKSTTFDLEKNEILKTSIDKSLINDSILLLNTKIPIEVFLVDSLERPEAKNELKSSDGSRLNEISKTKNLTENGPYYEFEENDENKDTKEKKKVRNQLAEPSIIQNDMYYDEENEENSNFDYDDFENDVFKRSLLPLQKLKSSKSGINKNILKDENDHKEIKGTKNKKDHKGEKEIKNKIGNKNGKRFKGRKRHNDKNNLNDKKNHKDRNGNKYKNTLFAYVQNNKIHNIKNHKNENRHTILKPEFLKIVKNIKSNNTQKKANDTQSFSTDNIYEESKAGKIPYAEKISVLNEIHLAGPSSTETINLKFDSNMNKTNYDHREIKGDDTNHLLDKVLEMINKQNSKEPKDLLKFMLNGKTCQENENRDTNKKSRLGRSIMNGVKEMIGSAVDNSKIKEVILKS